MPGRALACWYADPSSGIHLFLFSIHTIKLQRWTGKEHIQKRPEVIEETANSNVTSENKEPEEADWYFKRRNAIFNSIT